MSDEDILDRIRSLVEEEHALRDPGAGARDKRLAQVEEMLDQCWDLLRQRRAKREFGEDASSATARTVDTVEHYRQ